MWCLLHEGLHTADWVYMGKCNLVPEILKHKISLEKQTIWINTHKVQMSNGKWAIVNKWKMYYQKWHNGVRNCLARRPGSWNMVSGTTLSSYLPVQRLAETHSVNEVRQKILYYRVQALTSSSSALFLWGDWFHGEFLKQFSFLVQPRIKKRVWSWLNHRSFHRPKGSTIWKSGTKWQHCCLIEF